jgi:predicted nucleic acid-binding protein
VSGLPLLDTNVVLRHLLQDHADHSPRATAMLTRIGVGDLSVHVTASVFFEAVFTLERQQRVPKSQIRAALVLILAIPGLLVHERSRLERALDLFVERNIPFVDAYLVATMEDLGSTQIISFDRHFDRIPGIERVEP